MKSLPKTAIMILAGATFFAVCINVISPNRVDTFSCAIPKSEPLTFEDAKCEDIEEFCEDYAEESSKNSETIEDILYRRCTIAFYMKKCQ